MREGGTATIKSEDEGMFRPYNRLLGNNSLMFAIIRCCLHPSGGLIKRLQTIFSRGKQGIGRYLSRGVHRIRNFALGAYTGTRNSALEAYTGLRNIGSRGVHKYQEILALWTYSVLRRQG